MVKCIHKKSAAIRHFAIAIASRAICWMWTLVLCSESKLFFFIPLVANDFYFVTSVENNRKKTLLFWSAFFGWNFWMERELLVGRIRKPFDVTHSPSDPLTKSLLHTFCQCSNECNRNQRFFPLRNDQSSCLMRLQWKMMTICGFFPCFCVCFAFCVFIHIDYVWCSCHKRTFTVRRLYGIFALNALAAFIHSHLNIDNRTDIQLCK